MSNNLPEETLLKAFLLVEKFFDGDHSKTTEWFKARNPLLGGMTPYELYTLGRETKLLKFIETQLAENEKGPNA